MKLMIEVPDNTEIISVTAITAEDTEKVVNISTKVFVQTLHDFVKLEDEDELTEAGEPKEEDVPWE